MLTYLLNLPLKNTQLFNLLVLLTFHLSSITQFIDTFLCWRFHSVTVLNKICLNNFVQLFTVLLYINSLKELYKKQNSNCSILTTITVYSYFPQIVFGQCGCHNGQQWPKTKELPDHDNYNTAGPRRENKSKNRDRGRQGASLSPAVCEVWRETVVVHVWSANMWTFSGHEVTVDTGKSWSIKE